MTSRLRSSEFGDGSGQFLSQIRLDGTPFFPFIFNPINKKSLYLRYKEQVIMNLFRLPISIDFQENIF